MAAYGEMRIVYNHLPKIARAAPARAQTVVDKYAHLIQREAQRQIQVMQAIDTGAMLNSAYVATRRHSAYAKAMAAAKATRPQAPVLPGVRPTRDLEAIIAFAVRYAIYVHDGSKGRSGRPFLLQAMEMYRYPFIQTMKTVFKP